MLLSMSSIASALYLASVHRITTIIVTWKDESDRVRNRSTSFAEDVDEDDSVGSMMAITNRRINHVVSIPIHGVVGAIRVR